MVLNCKQSGFKSKQNNHQNTEKANSFLSRELVERPDFTTFASRTQTPTQPLLKNHFNFRAARFLNQDSLHFYSNTVKSSDNDRFQRK